MQEASPSVVFIKDLVVAGPQGRGSAGEEEGEYDEEEAGAKVEGTGSGFVWDSAGHIVSAFPVGLSVRINQGFQCWNY